MSAQNEKHLGYNSERDKNCSQTKFICMALTNGLLTDLDYALINIARGSYEEIFVLTFKAYGPNAVGSMRLERQNKYFPMDQDLG